MRLLSMRSGGLLAAAAVLGSILMPTPASATTPGQSTRNCSSFNDSGDIGGGTGNLRLDMCASYYVYGNGHSYRFLIQLHAYRYVSGLGWIDSRAQSLTVNSTVVQDLYNGTWSNVLDWGQDVSPSTCRHDSPDGPVGCSVPNAYRTDVYGAQLNYDFGAGGAQLRTLVLQVSYRDEFGTPHFYYPNKTSPSFVDSFFFPLP